MKPRRTELGLLIVAWAIGAVSFATVDMATLGTLPVNSRRGRPGRNCPGATGRAHRDPPPGTHADPVSTQWPR